MLDYASAVLNKKYWICIERKVVELWRKSLKIKTKNWRKISRNETVLSFHCLFLRRECPWIINRSFPAILSREIWISRKTSIFLPLSKQHNFWTLPIHSSSPNTGKIVSLKFHRFYFRKLFVFKSEIWKLWTRKCEKNCGKTNWIWKCLESSWTKNYWKN